MRLLAIIGRILAIIGLGTAAVAIWSVVLTGEMPRGPGGDGATGLLARAAGTFGRLSPDDTSAPGPGEAAGATLPVAGAGVAIGGSGAGLATALDGNRLEIRLPGGRLVKVSAPEGHGFGDRVRAVPDGAALVLVPPGGDAFTVIVLDGGEDMPGTLTGKIRVYETVAERLRTSGSGAAGLPFAAEEVRVDGRGVVFCLRPPAGAARLAGLRIRRGLSVIVGLRPDCAPPAAAEYARLERVTLAVTPDRWR